MKKLVHLLFAVITALISNSCSKDESESSNFTGYYNSKSVYQNDLLLRIVSTTGTSSFFGSGSGNDLKTYTNLYVSNTTGVKTITRINKTLDSIRVYELDKPELGGLLYVTKNSLVSVYRFEFVGTKNKINTTYHYTTLAIPVSRHQLPRTKKEGTAGHSIAVEEKKHQISAMNQDTPLPTPAIRNKLSKTNEDGTEGITKSLFDFNYWIHTLGLTGVKKAIEESLDENKANAIRNWENAQESLKESLDYQDKVDHKDPEPSKAPLEENPINQDEQKVINETIDPPFDCSKSTLAMTIGDPKITKGVASVTVKGIGGVGKYSFKWSDGQDGDFAVFSKSNTYTVTLTDSNGCSISSSVVIKVEADCTKSALAMTISDPVISNNVATVTANGIGGIGTYNYKWSDGQVGGSAAFSQSGTYTVTVTDGNGCWSSSSVVIDICKQSKPITITSTGDVFCPLGSSGTYGCMPEFEIQFNYTSDGVGYPYGGSYYGAYTPSNYPVNVEWQDSNGTWQNASNAYNVSVLSSDKNSGVVKIKFKNSGCGATRIFCEPSAPYEKLESQNWRYSITDKCGLVSNIINFTTKHYTYGK